MPDISERAPARGWPQIGAVPAAERPMGEPIVRLSKVAMRYGEAPALRDASLTIAPGSLVFLTGASGAGKSTLLRLIYLAQRPSEGLVSVFGIDTARARRPMLARLRRRIGVVFQDFRLLDHLTVFDNVALPLRIQGLAPRAYRQDVVELLEWVGLADRIGARPPTLSGGEKQRVAIARAVVAKPDLIVADEPTGNVDPDMGERLMRLFTELNRVGATVVIATHDHSLAPRRQGRILRLQDGCVIEGDG